MAKAFATDADPVRFYTEVLGCQTFYPKQEEMVRAVHTNRRVSVVGCNSSGKDFTTGRLVLDWLNRYTPSKVVVVGPTDRQVKDVVFQETRAASQSSLYPLKGRVLPSASYVYISPQHFAMGFTAPKAEPLNLQGFHSPNLLAIITEAHAMRQDHVDAVKRLNPRCIVMTGNPFASSGEFFESHHNRRDQWYTINISAFDTPNLIEGREVVPGLVTAEDVADHLADWGAENPLYIATVLGEFPENLSLGVVPLSKVMAAVGRAVLVPDRAKGIVACDVGGDSDDADKTVIYRRDGFQTQLLARLQGLDTQAIAGWLLSYWRSNTTGPDRNEIAALVVDANGLGAGVADRIREEEPDLPLVRFNAGAKAQRDDLYENRGTECYIRMRHAFMDDTISIPDDRATQSQLVGRKFEIRGTGKMILESKKNYKGRGSTSPDEADALSMTFAVSSTPINLDDVAEGMRKESAWKLANRSASPSIERSKWRVGGG